MSDFAERKCVESAMRQHFLEHVDSTDEGRAWMLCAAKPTIKPSWFNIEVNGSAATLFIGDNIGCFSTDAETVLSALAGIEEIRLEISSRGGDGVCALELFRGLGDRVTECVIRGHCYSAGVTIAMAARSIKIVAGSKIMVHPPRAARFGVSSSLRHCADYLDRITAEFADIIARRTKQPLETVQGWLAKDTYFDSSKAISCGFADAELAEDKLPVMPMIGALDLSDDETAVREFFAQLPAITVRDRGKFLRAISATLVHKTRQA